jgi:hypothetical protein
LISRDGCRFAAFTWISLCGTGFTRASAEHRFTGCWLLGEHDGSRGLESPEAKEFNTEAE